MPFNIALSGLNAAAADLEATANNIANVNTVGFKSSRAEFADIFASSGLGVSSTQNGNGVRLANVAQQFAQGNLQYTNNSLDLATTGQGFFTVKNGSGYAYTRAGDFSLDKDGFVVTATGAKLQVFPPTTTGAFDTSTTNDLQMTSGNGAPQATSTATLALNLPANATPPTTAVFSATDPTSYNQATSFTAYDSLGATHSGTIYYVNTGPDAWQARMFVDGNAVGAAIPLTFNTTGTLATPAGGVLAFPAYTIPGANPLTLSVNMASATQYGNTFSVASITQDGFASGKLSGISVDPTGVVSAQYSNGQSTSLGQIALTNFKNPQGLQKLGNTMWGETFNSGQAIRGSAGTGDFGQIQSGALETSNVDLTAQLVNMIQAQRNYQANAQVISTDDRITQAIINIRSG